MAKSRKVTFAHDCKASFGGTAMVFKSVSMPTGAEFSDGNYITGSRYPLNDRLVTVKDDIQVNFVQEPQATWASPIIQAMFPTSGGAGSAPFVGYTKYTLTDDPDGSNDIVIDWDGTNTSAIYTYSDMVLNTLKVSWSENNPVELSGEFLSVGTRTLAGTVAAPSSLAAPLIAGDVTVTIADSEYYVTEGEITFSQNLAERFYNSTTRIAVTGGMFDCSGSLTLDYNDDNYDDLFDLSYTTGTYKQIEINIHNGTTGFGFDLPAVHIISPFPDIPSSGEILAPLQFKAYKSGENNIVDAYIDIT